MQVTDTDRLDTDPGNPTEPGTCGPRALCGWSPTPLPADTSFKRMVDRVLVGNVPAVAVLVVVVGLLNLAPHLPVRGKLATEGLAGLIGGGWCSLNFWRCRHAHCAVTGAGWLSLAVFALIEAGLGHSVIGGDEQPVFLGVLAVGIVFECAWYLTHNSHAIRR